MGAENKIRTRNQRGFRWLFAGSPPHRLPALAHTQGGGLELGKIMYVLCNSHSDQPQQRNDLQNHPPQQRKDFKNHYCCYERHTYLYQTYILYPFQNHYCYNERHALSFPRNALDCLLKQYSKTVPKTSRVNLTQTHRLWLSPKTPRPYQESLESISLKPRSPLVVS